MFRSALPIECFDVDSLLRGWSVSVASREYLDRVACVAQAVLGECKAVARNETSNHEAHGCTEVPSGNSVGGRTGNQLGMEGLARIEFAANPDVFRRTRERRSRSREGHQNSRASGRTQAERLESERSARGDDAVTMAAKSNRRVGILEDNGPVSTERLTQNFGIAVLIRAKIQSIQLPTYLLRQQGVEQ
ncbi:hypothetical protein B0H17DRAFT_1148435 [Mycena rosella]|uniref:Uncharacterized protein n=1 Tax=Mycena rosella TaxID=1033263 RepID=A0AAD7CCZ3_MYCRO|nr:hypothetical protein B0H17DRAFT_1148435 [Mycena rosella]